MANTGKHITPRTTQAQASGFDGTVVERLSPRVEALRQLVASGRYHVSSRYLAYKILRAAGITPA